MHINNNISKLAIPFKYLKLKLHLGQQAHWICKSRFMLYVHQAVSVQFNSVTQSCLTLCNPMDCSMPGFPVQHQLMELTQTCPLSWWCALIWWCALSWWCHPTISSLLSASPPAFNLPQPEGLFQWVNSSLEVAKVLEFQLQHVLPMNIQDWFPWGLTDLIFLQSKGL